MSDRILISGSSGLIGTALTSFLQQQGYHVFHLVRSQPTQSQPNAIVWNIDKKEISLELLENFQAVIHLSGVSIAGRRWTPEYKQEIIKSRVESTQLLASSLIKLNNPPKVFVCASAIGYYGAHPPHEIIDEKHAPGNDFLSDVCRKWEEAAQIAKQKNIRVVNLRFGPVLSSKGGALAKMLPIFKLGLGGVLGEGTQVMSWIALEEIPKIVVHVLNTESLEGPVNAVAPQPISNKGFTKILGSVIKRPTVLPVPAPGVKLIFGEMGEELLLNGACVIPKKLLDSGYQFANPDLRTALKNSL